MDHIKSVHSADFSEGKEEYNDKFVDAIHSLTLAEAKDGEHRENIGDKFGYEKDSMPNTYLGNVQNNNTSKAHKTALGLRILEMSMRDATSVTPLWHSTAFDREDYDSISGLQPAMCFRVREMNESVPKHILSCRSICREIKFSSVEEITRFRLQQRVYLHGTCLEQWGFNFGFVMPGSTNSWQQIIEAAAPEKMIPAAVLSGNVTFETSFYDGDEFLCKNTVRLFYV